MRKELMMFMSYVEQENESYGIRRMKEYISLKGGNIDEKTNL